MQLGNVSWQLYCMVLEAMNSCNKCNNRTGAYMRLLMWAVISDVLFNIQLFLVVSIVNYIGEILQDYLGVPNFEADFGKICHNIQN